MAEALTIDEFLKGPATIFDVRSPKEFAQGRIPDAINLPLFSDEERAAVGTCYKEAGKEEAIQLGLRFVGPKLATLSAMAKSKTSGGTAKIYCWRGGMRSASMSWLMNLVGLNTAVLRGGYKTYRRWTSAIFSQPYRLNILGGMTGSGKTLILEALESMGEQVIDLEAIANHRGSSFGMVGTGHQPSTEQFENEIACRLAGFDRERVVWIEDESRQIGTCYFPPQLFLQLLQAPIYMIECSLEERIENLMATYGTVSSENLIKATQRISKRLGSERTLEIIDAINRGDLREAIAQVLRYYDAAYTYSLTKRSQKKRVIDGKSLTPLEWAARLINISNKSLKVVS